MLPIAALVLCHFLASAAPAQKKGKLEETGPQPKSWVAGYFITGLAITLGLVILCRPGTRTQDFRRPDDL